MASYHRNRSRREKMQHSVMMIFFVLAALLVCVYGRVIWIKVVHGEEYEAAAERQQISQTDVEIPALRGTIYDTRGQVMAESLRVYNVVLDCKAIQESSQALQESTVETLAGVLGIGEDVLRVYLGPEYADDRYELVKDGKGISTAQMEKLKQAQNEGSAVGIWFEDDENRYYPNGSLMAHVLGFNGAYGVERFYDEELRGTNGRQMITVNSAGSFVEESAPARDGDSLTLTLDATIQYYMEKALADGVNQYGAIQGWAVAMDPKTGAVFGLAKVPTFDLNEPTKVSSVSEHFTEQYGTPDSNTSYYQQVWKNSVITDTYEPGSTFKPIFASSALEEAVFGVGTTFLCEGTLNYYDREFQCAYKERHGVETIREIIANSCNIGMLQISAQMGVDRWIRYQDAFGIGQKSGIDLPEEVSASSLVYGESMYPVELATVSFGQGFNVTPIQLITAFSVVINGGELVRPYVVQQIADAAGNVIERNTKEVVRYSISKEVSDTMRGFLEAVVSEGTGAGAHVEGYSIGGKTGTAQKGNYEEERYICSFIGFTPVEDPKIVLLVVLDEPEEASSNQPSEIAANIFSEILPYMNIYPDQAS